MSANAKSMELGVCCACGSREATGIAMLPLKSVTPGTGWGCVQCGLPADGALTVLCNLCGYKFEHGKAEVRFAVAGYVGDGERVTIEELTEGFWHDESKHPELREPTDD
jgi:hypothetical protein